MHWFHLSFPLRTFSDICECRFPPVTFSPNIKRNDIFERATSHSPFKFVCLGRKTEKLIGPLFGQQLNEALETSSKVRRNSMTTVPSIVKGL